MPSDFILEICLDSAESALVVQEAGADRIELCAGLVEGGITPSLGMIKITRQLIDIPLNVIIRPRGGDIHSTPYVSSMLFKQQHFIGQAFFIGVEFVEIYP